MRATFIGAARATSFFLVWEKAIAHGGLSFLKAAQALAAKPNFAAVCLHRARSCSVPPFHHAKLVAPSARRAVGGIGEDGHSKKTCKFLALHMSNALQQVIKRTHAPNRRIATHVWRDP
jgi:hypothetical protein